MAGPHGEGISSPLVHIQKLQELLPQVASLILLLTDGTTREQIQTQHVQEVPCPLVSTYRIARSNPQIKILNENVGASKTSYMFRYMPQDSH